MGNKDTEIIEYFSLLIIPDDYRLDSPYALSYRGMRTQLQTSKPLRTQLQSLYLCYDPRLILLFQSYLSYMFDLP